MSVLIDRDTLLIVQGITGREGSYHTAQMLSYGTQIGGGVTPGKGGEWVHGRPVFDSVAAAVEATGANATIIYVGAAFAADAVYEAIDARIPLIVCVTEGIPVMDMLPDQPPGWTQLPRHSRACPREGRHYPQLHRQGGRGRRSLAQRHAHV
jgi:succinyl-CoA synthetase alpha subunit